MPRPISAKMFLDTISILPRGYTFDDVGGAVPLEGAGVQMPANVQSAGMDKAKLMPTDDANNVQGQSFYDVTTQTDPDVLPEQSILWNGLILIVQDAASRVFRRRLFRTRCVVRQ